MKALTFKKSALAVALLAAAGSASAASTVKFGTLTTVPHQITTATDVTSVTEAFATELALDDTLQLTTEADDAVLEIVYDGDSLSENDQITITFQNGGLNDDNNYKLITVNDTEVADGGNADDSEISEISTAIVSKSATNGLITAITFRITDASELDADDAIFLVDSNAADSGANNDVPLLTADTYGLDLHAAEDVSNNDVVSATVAIDFNSSSATDLTVGSAQIGYAKTGIEVTAPSAVTANVDFSESALKLADGDDNEDDSITYPGVTWAALGNTLDETADEIDYNFDGDILDATVAFTVADVNDVTNAFEFVMSDCSAVDSVTLGSTKLDKKTGETCTWEAGSAASGDDVIVAFDGENAIATLTGSATYDASYDSVANPSADVTSKTIISVSSDIVDNGDVEFPYLLAFNNNNAAFSFVKVDNTANSKPLVLAMKGTLQTPLVEDSEQVSFKNYYLKTIAAGEIGDISGDEIIAALVDAQGSADDGFNDTDLELDVTNLFNMSVTLQGVSGSSNGDIDNAEFSGVNTSSTGRTNVTFIK